MQKTVREIVANALDATGNDFLKAVDLMKKQVTADPKLYRELLDPFLGKACYVQVKKECRRRGVALSNTKPPTLEEGRAQVRAMARAQLMVNQHAAEREASKAAREASKAAREARKAAREARKAGSATEEPKSAADLVRLKVINEEPKSAADLVRLKVINEEPKVIKIKR
jgi:hypothetical protein